MGYNDLEDFLLRRMRMSHIYQPVMIKHLLENGGTSSDKEIAQSLLKYDPSQLAYYKDITNKMVGKVLRNHNVVQKEKDEYHLTAFNTLNGREISNLIDICEKKLEEYIFKRGEMIWKHRKKNRGYISGTVRFEVLKRAFFRCELCGISASEKAII